MRLLVATSWCRAPTQVGHAPQAQTLGHVAETLARGGEEAAQETAFAQGFEPGVPLIGAAAQTVENLRHRTRQRRLPLTENPRGQALGS